MNGPIEERYFEWLYSHIGSVRSRNPSKSWWSLAKRLHSTPFRWFVHNDDNRVADGLELRSIFIEQYGDGGDSGWRYLECSVFEMLIALAQRASFEADDKTPSDWFWEIMHNMNLDVYNDRVYNSLADQVIDEALAMLVNRQYREDGFGGLFPLKYPRQDQTRIEIWYQMSAYLLEREYEDVLPF